MGGRSHDPGSTRGRCRQLPAGEWGCRVFRWRVYGDVGGVGRGEVEGF